MASKEIAGVKISELDPGLSSNFDGEALLIVTGSEKDEAGNAIHKSVKMDLADDTTTGDKANPFFGLAAIQKLKEITKKESDDYTDEELLKYVQKDGDKVLSTNDFTDALKEKLESIDLNNPSINVAAFNKKEFTIIDGKVYLAEHGINEDRLNLDSDHRFVTDAQIELWNSKQNALNSAQINAVNSGITSAKVTQYDGYATSKQNALTAKQLTIVNLDPDQIHFDQWNAHVANSDIHVTLADKSNWNNKVTDIHPGEGVTIVETPGTVKDYTINVDTSGITVSGGTIQIPIGTIIPFMGAGVPDGFLKCDGSSYSRTTYAELFAVIGTRYGSTSSSTFKVPDLSDSRYMVGVGSFPAGEQKISPVLPNHIHGGTHGHGAGDHTHGVSISGTTLNHSHTITTNNLKGSILESHVNTAETIKVAEDPTGESVFKAVSLVNETKDVTISAGKTETTNQNVPTKSVTSEQSSGTVADYTGNTLGVVKSGNIYSGSDNIYAGADDQVVPRSMPVVFYIKAKKSSSDIIVDSALSTTSENPVQNKVVTTALNGKMPLKPTSIEFAGSVGTYPNGGYLDFHYNAETTKNFTSRIIEDYEGILVVFSDIGSEGRTGGTIRTSKNPSNDSDLTRKAYVDSSIAAATNASSSLGTRVTNLENTRVLRAGDTMSGQLKFSVGSGNVSIGRSDDAQGTWITGGTTNSKGGSLYLGGINNATANFADVFILRTSGNKALKGTNDGTLSWNGGTIQSTNFDGTATRAKWADLAEYYLMDEVYPIGTILQFGGSAEMTAAFDFVSGVVSERPALVMNTEFEKYHNAQPVALIGRVKVRVEGRVKKFDLIGLHPDKPGIAIKVTNRKVAIGTVLKGKNSSGEGLVLVSLKSNI